MVAKEKCSIEHDFQIKEAYFIGEVYEAALIGGGSSLPVAKVYEICFVTYHIYQASGETHVCLRMSSRVRVLRRTRPRG